MKGWRPACSLMHSQHQGLTTLKLMKHMLASHYQEALHHTRTCCMLIVGMVGCHPAPWPGGNEAADLAA